MISLLCFFHSEPACITYRDKGGNRQQNDKQEYPDRPSLEFTFFM